ncbi:unnamed protein product [Lymnaea stagnalis]|uniref:Uncharacterized protein n=1 Tax=Lymnaea stagnalis TaxID=6523 RepID=A0AAV2H3A6_LYMST
MSYGYQSNDGGVIQTQPYNPPDYNANTGVNNTGFSTANTSNTSNTIVVVQQPGPIVIPKRDWSTSLFGCLEDVPICLAGMCCSLCLSMKVAHDMDECLCLQCCVPSSDLILRVKLRAQENITVFFFNDCMITYCFPQCSLCQLAREAKAVKARRTHIVQ